MGKTEDSVAEVLTGIRISSTALLLLRELADARAQAAGHRRPNVSAVVEDLVRAEAQRRAVARTAN